MEYDVVTKVKANATKYNELKKRMLLLEANYEKLKIADWDKKYNIPESVYQEYQTLLNLTSLISISTLNLDTVGEKDEYVTESGLIIDSLRKNRVEEKLGKIKELTKINDTIINTDIKIELLKVNLMELDKKLNDVNNPGQALDVGMEALNLETKVSLEDRYELLKFQIKCSNKAVKLDKEKKLQVERERKEAEQRKNAYQDAKQRYDSLKFMSKLKLKLKRKDIKHVSMYNNTVEELEGMYKEGRTR